MLDSNLKTQLAGYLEKVTRPIDIVVSVDDGAKSYELLALLNEIASMSNHVNVVSGGTDARRPSFTIGQQGQSPAISFAGIPMGHEFNSLVLALLQTGGHPVKLDQTLIEQICDLTGEYQFETYYSQSCQNCPEVVQTLNLMALLNRRIRHVAIDGALFQDEVETRDIMAVPTMFLNGKLFSQGRCGVKDVLARLDSHAGARAAHALSNKPAFDVLIIGGGPAGAAAAIYAARKGISTGMLAGRFGGQVLDTLTIENFVSVPETEGPVFATALEQHVKQYGVDVMDAQEAKALTPGRVHEVQLANGAVLKARAIVLATGARWRELNVPGEREYRNRGVAYCPHCDGPLFKGKRLAVIGGGNSGVEAAIDLAGITSHVTLIEYGTQLRADEVLQRKLRTLANVTVLTNAQTRTITGDGKKVNGLDYVDIGTKETRHISVEGVFVQIGLVPNSEWLDGAVQLSKHGEVVIDSRGATSVPGVFAAGDVTTVPFKQIVVAVGEGAKASLAAFDYLIRSSIDEPQTEVVADAQLVD